MLKSGDLESQFRKWREDRARKQSERPTPNDAGRHAVAHQDRRTVRVNGQEVVVVTKPKRSASLA